MSVEKLRLKLSLPLPSDASVWIRDRVDALYRTNEAGAGGWYPVGASQLWHCGIHLTAPQGTEVRSGKRSRSSRSREASRERRDPEESRHLATAGVAGARRAGPARDRRGRAKAPPAIGRYETDHGTLVLVQDDRHLIASFTAVFPTAGGSTGTCECLLEGARPEDGIWRLRSEDSESTLEVAADSIALKGLGGCCGLGWSGEERFARTPLPLSGCAVKATRAPSFAPTDPPTQLAAYVVKGDRVEAYTGAPLPGFAPARFVAPRSRTAGLLRRADLECDAAPGRKR